MKIFRRRRIAVFLLIVLLLLPSVITRIQAARRVVVLHQRPSFKTIEATNAGGTLRVATWNIAHGRGMSPSNYYRGDLHEQQRRMESIGRLIRKQDCDIVVLNEVDFSCSWSGGENQAVRIAEQAGFPFCVEQRNIDVRLMGWTWNFGNAVLSKHPIKFAKEVSLPADSQIQSILIGDKRGIDATANIHGQEVRIIGLHLAPDSEPVRIQSAKMINDMLSKHDGPAIVIGDLNSSPPGFSFSDADHANENAMQILESTGKLARHQKLPIEDETVMTFPSDHPDRIIDWILASRHWVFVDIEVIPTDLSDHRMVVGTLELVSN